MISRLLGDAPFPVAFGFPAGHTDDNLPLALGSKAILTVTPDGTSLSMS